LNEGPIPPPRENYAAYPRANVGPGFIYGTSEKLTKLYRGYHGMSYAVLCAIGTYILMLPPAACFGNPGWEILGYILCILPIASFVGIFFFSVRSGMDIGFGNGWSPAFGVILGILAPCVGVIMCIVMQYLATAEMKRYGIVTRPFLGIDRDHVRATIANLAAMEKSLQPGIQSQFQT
jgi:hypothetical protein